MRYTNIILKDKRTARKYATDVNKAGIKTDKFVGYLNALDVSLTEPCTGTELPELYMDENCKFEHSLIREVLILFLYRYSYNSFVKSKKACVGSQIYLGDFERFRNFCSIHLHLRQ